MGGWVRIGIVVRDFEEHLITARSFDKDGKLRALLQRRLLQLTIQLILAKILAFII